MNYYAAPQTIASKPPLDPRRGKTPIAIRHQDYEVRKLRFLTLVPGSMTLGMDYKCGYDA